MKVPAPGCIILIGGQGTRLRPLTLSRPKALMPILNKPFLSYQLERLAQAGIHEVTLAAGILNRPWESALRKLSPRGVKFSFAYEKKPLGTGGAIRFGFDNSRFSRSHATDPVLVLNGDILFELDVQAFLRSHLKRRADVSIALIQVDDPSHFGLVKMNREGKIFRFTEKPRHFSGRSYVNAGAYLLSPYVIRGIPRHRTVSVEREIFPRSLKEKKNLFGFHIKGYWNDIGTPATYLAAHDDLLGVSDRWTPRHLFRKRGLLLERPVEIDSSISVQGKALIGRRSRLGQAVSFQGNVCLGRHVTIEPGSVISDSVLLDGVRVGKGVTIERAVIGQYSRIGDHSHVGAGAVLGDGSVLTAYSRI